MRKQVIVIGGGIAGLSAAIYAGRSGFDVTLCEQHSIVGGMCTSWRRKGYLFEGAIHWLTGSSPKTQVYQMWKETGALDDTVKIYLHDIFRSIEWEGKILNLYRSIDTTAEHLLVLSPADEKEIRRLVKRVKTFTRLEMPVMDIQGVKARNPKPMPLGYILKALPAIIILARLGKLSCTDYCNRFQHPGIRKLLACIPGDFSASSILFTLATLNMGDGGYPEGGSLAMTARMAETFKNLGGKLLLNTEVKKVVIENGAVTGVQLENEILPANAVIVTQETIAALDRLFDTPLHDAWLRELRETTKLIACTYISMGVRAELPETIPEWQLDEPIRYADTKITEIGFGTYARYAGYAPGGCAALTTALMGDTWHFWKKAKEEGRYDEEKRALAEQISRAFCRKYPQAEGNIEVMDIATPLTYERYAGAYHGSWMTLMEPGHKMAQAYPGFAQDVHGLYFAGHRIIPPGGHPAALASGRRAAQMVCRQFDAVFV
ncbi:MAG: NAD(P)/FAD-dependent oxidoreductase [Spirochaetota bacterium]|jgi:phytoene dehydrogenase-like protein|nr:NAD(P)/FAD-dependent oxidoreductase [Spirochaetota bacterium]